jgi:hypothetical protein
MLSVSSFSPLLPVNNLQALQIMVRAYRLLEKAGVDATVRFQKIQELLPLFVGMPNKVDVQVQTLDESSTFSSFPLPSSWQDEELRLLSTRAHNLCVASSVTNFSGWESEEFNLDLLQRKGRSNYFGISLNDGRVLGHISVELAKGLSEIWSTASSAVGVEIDFAGSLEKASTFLMEDCHVEPLPNNDDVATYGENHTLFVLVDYARLCFEKALTTDATAGERTKSTQLGLSLLLPIVSQNFVVCMRLSFFLLLTPIRIPSDPILCFRSSMGFAYWASHCFTFRGRRMAKYCGLWSQYRAKGHAASSKEATQICRPVARD